MLKTLFIRSFDKKQHCDYTVVFRNIEQPHFILMTGMDRDAVLSKTRAMNE